MAIAGVGRHHGVVRAVRAAIIASARLSLA